MTIAEVSKEYDITPETLRYYEKVNLLPRINRKNGIRDYSPEDCNWIEFIKCMRASGMSIAMLAEYVKLFGEGDETIKRRKELLVIQRQTLLEKQKEIEKTIERLNYKIDNYDQRLYKVENNLK